MRTYSPRRHGELLTSGPVRLLLDQARWKRSAQRRPSDESLGDRGLRYPFVRWRWFPVGSSQAAQEMPSGAAMNGCLAKVQCSFWVVTRDEDAQRAIRFAQCVR